MVESYWFDLMCIIIIIRLLIMGLMLYMKILMFDESIKKYEKHTQLILKGRLSSQPKQVRVKQ